MTDSAAQTKEEALDVLLLAVRRFLYPRPTPDAAELQVLRSIDKLVKAFHAWEVAAPARQATVTGSEHGDRFTSLIHQSLLDSKRLAYDTGASAWFAAEALMKDPEFAAADQAADLRAALTAVWDKFEELMPDPLRDQVMRALGLVEFEGGACEHESATGVDQNFGPDKVWRCDGCGFLYRTVTKDGITHEVPGSQEPRAGLSDTQGEGDVMRYWFDTEFMEDGTAVELLSIGVVAEDGREYYAVSADADYGHANKWVRENVLPHLGVGFGTAAKPRSQIASELGTFLLHPGKPEIWAYYGDYDWVVLCQLFGRMVDLPEGMPMFALDVKQLAVSLGNPKLPEQTSTEHNALEDARWTREAWEFLTRRAEVAPSKGDVDGVR